MLSSLRTAAALCLLTALGACSSITDSLSPGRPASDAPARVALSASLPRLQSSQTRPVSLGVVASYLRRDAEPALLSSQRIPLSEAATQQVPVSIELAVCLADEQRSTAFTEPRICQVMLSVSLLAGGQVLDVVELGPIQLQPGGTVTVVQPVTLFEIESVFLSIAPSTQPLPFTVDTLVVGSSVAFLANARDASGASVTDRVVQWMSSNSAVLNVASGGVVTALAPGSARVTATIGGRSTSLDIVVRPPVRRLTVVGVPGSGGGRVVSSPAGIDCTLNGSAASGTCAFDFNSGTSVSLTASITQGAARFGGWTGACMTFGSAPTCTLVMSENRTAGAGFTALSPITVQSTGSDIRISSGSSAGISCTFMNGVGSGSCSAPFPVGSTVVLDRSHLGVVRVLGFTGCDASTANACTINVRSGARTITVNTRAGGVLEVVPTGNGGGRISATGANAGALADITCERAGGTVSGSCSGAYPGDTLVTVSAVADARSRFVRWARGGCSAPMSSTCVVRVPTGGTALVEAEFALDVAPITLNLIGSGGGRVRADGDVVCEISASQTSRQCVFEARLGRSLELSGEPAGSGAFLGFGGACSTSGTTCTIAVTGAASVTASFSAVAPRGEIKITSVIAADALGRVITSNGDIACDVISDATSGDCRHEYTYGTSVTLQAQDIANLGIFRRWGAASPCPGSTSLSCTFTVSSGSITASAEFRRPARVEVFIDAGGGSNPYLNMAIAVDGFRSLANCTYTGLPAGGLQCSWTVPMGLPSTVPITLTATTASGYEIYPFYFPCSWSGTLIRQSCTFSLQGDITGDVFSSPASQPARIP